MEQEQSLFSAETTMKSPIVIDPGRNQDQVRTLSLAPAPATSTMIDAMYGANPSQQLQADPDFESRDQPAGDLGEVRVSPNTGGVVPAREDENVGIQGMLAAMQQQMSQMSNQMQTNKTEIAEQLQEQMQSVKIELKEIQLKQDVTTASLTSIDEIMTERRTSNTPDSISGLTGASAFTDALKVEIRATIIDSLREAYTVKEEWSTIGAIRKTWMNLFPNSAS